MMRNDYRRSLILLRSNASGYSGHVRLERRTLMGTMYFLVQTPGDCPALRAALVGRGRDGNYFACALGELQQDARGQAVLGYSFDPRDICKRELEQYQLIAVTCAGDESCQVALFGNVCGHAELNWEGVRAALCELYAGETEPAAPGGTEPQPDGAAVQAQPVPVTELPEAAQTGDPASEASVGAGTSAASAAEASPDGSGAPGMVQAEPLQGAPDPVIQPEPNAAPAALEQDVRARASGDPAAPEQGSAAEAGGELAGDLLEAQGVSPSAPWPGAAEALRALFQTSPALTDAPDDQCVYVEAPMPEGSGFPFVAAGLLILGGALAAIRYALPAAWSEEPPAGLEDCTWIGDQNKGWWLTEVPVAGGAGSHMLPR